MSTVRVRRPPRVPPPVVPDDEVVLQAPPELQRGNMFNVWFTALPALYHVLRWAGAAYLLYLAIKSFRDRGESGEEDAAPVGPGRLRAFWQGVVTNLLNPKVILFNIAFLPQFVNPSMGHPMVQLLVLGVTLVLIGLAVDGCVGLLSGRLANLLRRSRRVARALNIFSGTVFTGLAVRLIAVPK